MTLLENAYANKRALIIGGLGFLGSNLTHHLVDLGTQVTILDALLEPYGGNHFNLAGVSDRVEVCIGDVRDAALVEKLVDGQDFIFNFAAQVSYIDSFKIPLIDLGITCQGVLNVLEACQRCNRHARILYPSSRMVYGRIIAQLVDEQHPTRPLSLYGMHKLLSEQYHWLYARQYGLRCVILRISNPYGPRQQMKHSKYSIVGWFIRMAMEGRSIEVFGDGRQLREYIYADDLTEAFLLAGAMETAYGETYNIGSGQPVSFIEMVRTVVETVEKGSYRLVPWPSDYEANETGDYVADTRKIEHDLRWKCEVSLKEGIQRTYDYYRQFASYYF